MNPKHTVNLENLYLPTGVKRKIDELRIVFVATQLLLQSLEERGILAEKSIKKSSESRKAGNDLYIKKGHDSKAHKEILKCYSQSIMFAPMGSEELALGYGNRSSLLMHLQLYEEALLDIDRALQLSKAGDYKKKLQARKEKCLELIISKQNSRKAPKNSSLGNSEELRNLASKLKNFKPSSEVPCAADCVGLAYNTTFGRHLVATRDIEPGENIIVEKASACYPLISEKCLVCSHCLQYAWNGIPCNECVHAIYCSEACKNEAYNEYHDIECPMFKYMEYTVFKKELYGCDRMVTIRVLIQAVRIEGFLNVMNEVCKREGKDNYFYFQAKLLAWLIKYKLIFISKDLGVLLTDGALQSEKFKSTYNLLSNVKHDEDDDDKLEFHSTQILYILLEHTDFLVSCIKENPSGAETNTMNLPGPMLHNGVFTLNPYTLLALRQTLLKLKNVIVTNQYLFENRHWQCGCSNNPFECDMKCNLMRGITMVPCCALLNHSCTSNVSHLCVPQREIIVFSTCPIKKGEMLCDSYRGVSILDSDLKLRQIKNLYFNCKCKACMDKIDMHVAMDNYMSELDKIYVGLDNNFSKSVTHSFLENSVQKFEVSEEVFQRTIKISQFIHKNFNYYKAFMHSYNCKLYFEKMMSKLYKEKNFMPNRCSGFIN